MRSLPDGGFSTSVPRGEVLVSLVSLFPRDQSASSGFVFPSYPADKIRQVWNVIEGQQSGVSVFIFDSDLGKVKARTALLSRGQ
jgi:hypothetical protein